jgi:hypothetical protein
MNGQFETDGKNYEWWAGPASPDAEEDYCVHCRRGDWGVTKYVESSPSQSTAEQTARTLASQVDTLSRST